jgi:hypothetical protein
MTIPYKRLNALDKTYKPLILKWLSKLFNYDDYPHSHTDQWINWHIHDGYLSVSFDLRQIEQIKLLSLIHPRFIGIPQYTTLKIVNEQSFYVELERLFKIDYPNIVYSKLINSVKHKDNDGDTFHTYDWEVFLEDNSSIIYHNQTQKMDMVKDDYTYKNIIEERSFVEFLKTIQ